MDITIDDITGTIKDNQIRGDLGTGNNWGGSAAIAVGASGDQRSLFGVDLSSYGGYECVSAKWSIRHYVDTGVTNVSWYRVYRDWGEGTGANTPTNPGESSWDDYADPNAWATGGCDNTTSDRSGTPENDTPITMPPKNQYNDWDLKPASVTADMGGWFSTIWIDPTSVGIVLLQTSESAYIPSFYMEYIEAVGVSLFSRGRMINL